MVDQSQADTMVGAESHDSVTLMTRKLVRLTVMRWNEHVSQYILQEGA